LAQLQKRGERPRPDQRDDRQERYSTRRKLSEVTAKGMDPYAQPVGAPEIIRTGETNTGISMGRARRRRRQAMPQRCQRRRVVIRPPSAATGQST
jgi:hypothetical protein